MRLIRSIFLTVAVLCFVISGFSQSAELEYGKGKRVTIVLSNEDGTGSVNAEQFNLSETMYFKITPSSDWEFGKKDLKTIPEIKILLNDVSYYGQFETKYDPSGKDILYFMMAFSKEGFDLTQRFEFVFEENTSDAFQMREEYWPFFSEFTHYFKTGEQYLQQDDFLNAYLQFVFLAPWQPNHENYINFTDYKLHFSSLITESVEGYIQQYADGLNEYEGKTEIDQDDLNQLATQKILLDSTKRVFAPYFALGDPKASKLEDDFNGLIKDYDDKYHGLYMDWKEKMLSIFEGKTYNDGVYKQYIELLTKLLCYRNEIDSFDGMDSIPTDILVDNYKTPAFIKPNRDQLVRMKRYDDFLMIIDLLNNNIWEKGFILSNKGPTSAMMTLKMNQHSESLPSFYIISAFNALVAGDMNSFEKGILLAIKSCTDKEIIYNLEFWLISMNIEVDRVNEEVLGFLNNGLEMELRLPEKAMVEYEAALLIQNDYAPAYYLLGRVIYNYKRNRADAELKFEEALRFDPDFISAAIMHIEIMKDRRIYSDAINKINYWFESSSVLDIWYLNYLKAQMLFEESQYSLSKETLIHDCIPLNDNNFDQSILLGDIYIRQSNCDSAYIHYKNAGEINSTSKTYNTRMRSYDSMCRQNY